MIFAQVCNDSAHGNVIVSAPLLSTLTSCAGKQVRSFIWINVGGSVKSNQADPVVPLLRGGVALGPADSQPSWRQTRGRRCVRLTVKDRNASSRQHRSAGPGRRIMLAPQRARIPVASP
jgi:hypothetical protein